MGNETLTRREQQVRDATIEECCDALWNMPDPPDHLTGDQVIGEARTLLQGLRSKLSQPSTPMKVSEIVEIDAGFPDGPLSVERIYLRPGDLPTKEITWSVETYRSFGDYPSRWIRENGDFSNLEEALNDYESTKSIVGWQNARLVKTTVLRDLSQPSTPEASVLEREIGKEYGDGAMAYAIGFRDGQDAASEASAPASNGIGGMWVGSKEHAPVDLWVGPSADAPPPNIKLGSAQPAGSGDERERFEAWDRQEHPSDYTLISMPDRVQGYGISMESAIRVARQEQSMRWQGWQAALSHSSHQVGPEVEDILKLASRATQGEWELQDGSSWRRIGLKHGPSGEVLCPTNCHRDGHPDLTAYDGKTYENLRFIVAACNHFLRLFAQGKKEGVGA